MKISASNSHRRQRGFATFFLLALVMIMVMLITINSRMLLHLHGELKLLEQRQVQRLNASQTNQTAAAVSPAPQESK